MDTITTPTEKTYTTNSGDIHARRVDDIVSFTEVDGDETANYGQRAHRLRQTAVLVMTMHPRELVKGVNAYRMFLADGREV